jgi:uncharacterized protein (DUF1499 family)
VPRCCAKQGDRIVTTSFLDFQNIKRPRSRNHWLVAPEARSDADQVAPRFALSPEQLTEHWHEVVSNQPRTRVTSVSDDRLRIEAEQRSALFRFVDVISFQAIEDGDGHATFFAFSRSLSGYWDLGVNRKRLRHWVGLLSDAIGKEPVVR